MAERDEQRDRHHASAVRTLAYIMLGPIVWALHLTVVYCIHALLCARGLSHPVLGLPLPSVVIFAASAAALAPLLAAMFAPGVIRRIIWSVGDADRHRPFHDSLMALLAALSAFGVILAGAIPILIPACAQLR